jgi:adenine phosphoribosyltransferase
MAVASTCMIDLIAHRYVGQSIDKIVGVEARGFILGSALAYKLGLGVTMVRKPGKLPAKVRHITNDLVYGTDTHKIHEDAFEKGDKVIIADDLLATGGKVSAVVKLVEELGAEVVECAFMAELDFLEGRKRLPEGKVYSLFNF